MQRLHLYQLGPQAYALSRKKEILKRKFQDQIHQIHFAQTRSEALLPVVVNRHNSLIRRKLGDVDQRAAGKQGRSICPWPLPNSLIY